MRRGVARVFRLGQDSAGSMDRGTLLRLAVVSGGVAALPGALGWSRRPIPPRHRGVGASSSPARVAVRELEDRVVLSNDAGDWSVWKRLVWSAGGERVVGPGYVGRFEPRGELPPFVDDFRASGAINDPRFGGLGAFGWHHARAGRGAWDIDGRLDAARNGGFGVARASVIEPASVAADGTGRVGVRVEFRDGWQDAVMSVTYRYLVAPRLLISLIDVEQRWRGDGEGQAFVKGPKLVAAVAPAYRLVDVYGATGELVRRIDVGNLSEPWKQTAQIGAHDRQRVAFVGAAAAATHCDDASVERKRGPTLVRVGGRLRRLGGGGATATRLLRVRRGLLPRRPRTAPPALGGRRPHRRSRPGLPLPRLGRRKPLLRLHGRKPRLRPRRRDLVGRRHLQVLDPARGAGVSDGGPTGLVPRRRQTTSSSRYVTRCGRVA